MAKRVATVAMPLQLKTDKFNSPLDARQLLVIEGDEPTLEDFQTILEPYIHMRVHVHKTDSYEEFEDSGRILTNQCVGVYEVDSIEEYKKGFTTSTRIKEYHKVYSTEAGLYENYKPNDKHKDIIYYCTDTSGDKVGKVYLNNSSYGGGQAPYRFNDDKSLLIVTDGSDDYAANLTPYTAPKNVRIENSDADTVASKVLQFKSDTAGVTFQYAIKSNGTWGSWTNGSSYTFNASTATKTTEITIKCRATKNGLTTESREYTFTTSRHVANPVISANGNKYSETRTITITCSTTSANIYYTTDGLTPTASSTKYNSASKPTITVDTTFKAIAILADWENSGVVTSDKFEANKPRMYWGVVDSLPTNLSGIKALGNQIEKDTIPQTIVASGSALQYLVFAVKSSITVSKMTGGGFDYDFNNQTVGDYKLWYVRLGGTMSNMTWVIS